MKSEVVDFDTHLKILNFLLHLQSIGIITEEQNTCYSNHIQEYLIERKNNLEFMESFVEDYINSRN